MINKNKSSQLTMADSSNLSNSDHDEEENLPKKRAATTKKRNFTYQAMQQFKPCSIYSSAANDIKLPNINACLPDSDDEECMNDAPINKKKRQVKKKNARTRKTKQVTCLDSDDEITIVRTPEKTSRVISLDSPCSPPPPPDQLGVSQRPLVHDKATSNVLRSINVALTNVRCIQNEVYSQSDDGFSPLPRTPGGSLAVIDVDEISPALIRNSMTVKIRSRSKIHRYLLQMHDKFTTVVDDLASQEGVTRDWVKLVKDGQDISEYDSPSSISLHIADIIDCLIVDPQSLVTETSVPSIEVTIQGKERKSVMTTQILWTDTLQRIMEEYSAFCGRPLKKLKFTFDGDVIKPTDTPASLDFEEDTNTIDAMYK